MESRGDVPQAESGGEVRQPGSVQEALELILSKKNLVRDQLLAGRMNPQMYIPIQVLLGHEKLQGLGSDGGPPTKEEIAAAAENSTRLGIDDDRRMVKPMLKAKRNVVILRDVPEGTTEEEMREILFGAPHEEQLVHVRPDVNNTWFLKFNIDEGIEDIVLWLRSKHIKERPVNASVKSEHFLRSFFPAPAPITFRVSGDVHLPGLNGFIPPNFGSGKGAFPGGGIDGQRVEAGLHPELQKPGFWKPWGGRSQQQQPTSMSAAAQSYSMPVVAQQAAPINPEIFDNLGQHDGYQGKSGQQAGGGGKAHGRGANGKFEGKGSKPLGNKAVAPAVPLGPSGQAVPSQSSSYQHDFRKYTRQQFLDVCRVLQAESLVRPKAFESLGGEVPIFREVPLIEISA
eukprot:TRINITY_DN48623_c0_g1_i1.p1 TRINITY_DN48623_c0_g1~~TRINITY_DN48623_c0_g1_i1.p1  ORF type:complete len:399 (+),score=81.41 TRINITY_DN48623_c0_g1_i1:171-1367(+)